MSLTSTMVVCPVTLGPETQTLPGSHNPPAIPPASVCQFCAHITCQGRSGSRAVSTLDKGNTHSWLKDLIQAFPPPIAPKWRAE